MCPYLQYKAIYHTGKSPSLFKVSFRGNHLIVVVFFELINTEFVKSQLYFLETKRQKHSGGDRESFLQCCPVTVRGWHWLLPSFKKAPVMWAGLRAEESKDGHMRVACCRWIQEARRAILNRWSSLCTGEEDRSSREWSWSDLIRLAQPRSRVSNTVGNKWSDSGKLVEHIHFLLSGNQGFQGMLWPVCSWYCTVMRHSGN